MSTDTAHYARLREWFERCADMAPGERGEWLDRHLDDTSLRIELELMFAADANDAALLNSDAASLIGRLDEHTGEFDAATLIGRRYGAFRLTAMVGRGGQGVVYRAERADADFAQTVAVKLLRRGLHDTHEHRRFRRERDILARLDHPGVARLIDGGVSEEGVPYLVMDFVAGEPIDRWCEQQALDTRARLVLFERLCSVVAAAHRALIVHRDLKPSNVLVTHEGAIKVLDFGIASLLDEDAGEARTLGPLLTPGYGAPEQANGGAITLAADVHALGMLLRQLLTGQAPRPHGDAGAGVVHRPLAPELAWIIGKATETEPGQRYRDAAELAEDIARYLSARPVLAHPPSPTYVMRKFVRRHRGGVLTTLALLLGVLASAGVALWQARVAREQAQRAQATSDFLLDVFKSAQDGLSPGDKPTPAVLVQAAARRLEADTTLPVATRADFLATLGDVARYSSDAEAALPLYSRAIELRADQPDSRERLRAEVMRAMTLSRLGRAAEAAAALEPRLPTIQSVADATTVEGLWAYADALGELGRMDEYLHGMEEARRVAATVHAPTDGRNLILDGSYAIALYSAGRAQDSADMLESVIARYRQAGLSKDRDYAISLANLGVLKHELGDLDAAETYLREAVDLERQIHASGHPNTAIQAKNLGQILTRRGKSDEAEALLTQARAQLLALYGPAHHQSLDALNALAVLDIERQRYADAVTRVHEAADACTQLTEGSGAVKCMDLQTTLAEALAHSGQLEHAADLATGTLARRRELVGADNPDNATTQQVHAAMMLAQGHAREALVELDAAAVLYGKAGVRENIDIATLQVDRARALLALGRAGEALTALAAADPMLTRFAPDSRGRRLRLLATRAAALATLGRADGARATAREALVLASANAVLEPGEWEQLQTLAR